MHSSGSAMKENEVYMNSLEGKLKSLDSSFQSFAKNTIDSNVIKSLLELGTNLIKFADSDAGRAILKVTLLIASFKLLSKGFSMLGTSIVTNGQALFQYLLIMQGVPAAEAAATAATLGFTGSIKLLTTALLTNPLFLGAAALTGVIALAEHLKSLKKEARETAQTLSDKSLSQASELENLLGQYKELSKKTNRTAEEEKKLGEVVDDLNKKYDISKEALSSEGAERDEAIKKIQKEIEEKKKLAATSAESAIDFKKGDRDVLTSRDAVSVDDDLAKKYDLQGKNLSEVQKKMYDYIATLQNKTNKTKDEEKELEKLMALYGRFSGDLDTYKEGYKQSYENLKAGIPITTEQANALYQLGDITEEDAMKIQAYNDLVSQGKDVNFGAVEAQLSFNEAQADNVSSTQELIQKNAEQTSSLKTLNEDLDNLQKTYSTLSGAVDEYNSNGYLSIDTLQSLLNLSDDELSALSLENGQLTLNTMALDKKTDALIAERIALLQTAATNDLYNLSIGNTDALSSTAKTAISNLGTDVDNTKNKMQSAIPTMQSFNAELGKVAEKYGITSEEGKKQAGAIIESYNEQYKKITSLGNTTTKAGGTSGRGHKYTGSSKKSGSGSKSSKSTKEEYKAEVDALYSYKNALDIAKDSVDQLNDALKNTDNFNEQEKYLNKLIDATNNEINKTNELKNAQTSQINDYINQLRAQGFAIDYNSSKNELYINNMQHLADLSGDNAKAVEKLLDKIQDLNDNNRSLDSSVRDLTSDTKDYYDQLADIPEQKLKKFNELMEDFQQSRLDQIQNQIDDIQHEMDNDERIKAINKQIEALEAENDTLDSQKELEEKILAVEQAKEKLANANKQKTIQIYRENQGWVDLCPAA